MFQAFLNMLPANGMHCIMQKDHGIKEKFYKLSDLTKETFQGMKNVFFTPNQLGYRYDKENKKPTLQRNKQHLNQLCCLYVDIDFKDSEYDVPPTVTEVLDYSEAHIFGTEVPEPTMIVSSGNGIHMYWVINPVSWKQIREWSRMQQHIYEVYRRFGADSCIAKDAVRLLRVPGTVNEKETGTKQCTLLSFKANRYELKALLDDFDVKMDNLITISEKRKEKANKSVRKETKRPVKKTTAITPVIPVSALYSRRAKDLEVLLLKYWDKPLGGNREKILFLYRYLQLHLLQNESDALRATLELNNRLTYKLTDKEVSTATKSAEKYYKGTQLNWKTSTYIEFLGITDEQARSLKTLLTARVKAERRNNRYEVKLASMRSIYRASVGIMKADKVFMRQCDVYQLMLAGLSAEQIMQKLSISKSTYYRDVQIVKTAQWLERYEQAAVCDAYESLEATGTDGVAVSVTEKKQSEHTGKPAVIRVCSAIPKISAPYNYCDVMLPAPEEPVAFKPAVHLRSERDYPGITGRVQSSQGEPGVVTELDDS